MNRRLFLLSALAAANIRTPTGVDMYVQKFPKNLPGIKRTTTYAVQGSDYLLVHVRQIHRTSSEEAALLEPIQNGFDVDEKAYTHLEETEAVQNDIYNALNSARQRRIVAKVMREGRDESTPSDEKAWKQLNWTRNAYREIQKQKRTADNADFLDTMELYLPLLERDILANLGAQGRLAKEGVLEQTAQAKVLIEKTDPTIIRYEKLDDEYQKLRTQCLHEESKNNSKTLHQLEDALRKKGDERALIFNSPEFDRANEHRENGLLEYCVKKGPGIYWTVFGGWHDWSENITQYNANHRKKFSLIVLTPEHYVENLEKHSRQK